MSQLSDWMPFGTAFIGIAGTLIASYMSDQHARRREEQRWLREGERERGNRDREERDRTFSHKSGAYIEFMSIWRGRADVVDPRHGPEPPEDWLVPVWRAAESVQLFGTREAGRVAEEAASRLMDYTFRHGEWNDAEKAMDRFREQARRDLGVPD